MEVVTFVHLNTYWLANWGVDLAPHFPGCGKVDNPTHDLLRVRALVQNLMAFASQVS